MTHKRQLIRQRMAQTVGTVAAFAGRVSTNRARPVDVAELPLATIYTTSESAEPANAALDLTRILDAVVEIRAAGEDLDDRLDQLSQAVESALAGDMRLGGLATYIQLTSTAIGLDRESQTRQAIAMLTYSVRYETSPAGL